MWIDGALRLRRTAEPAHGLVQVVCDLERIIEAGEDAHRAPLPPVAGMQARATATGLAGAAAETAAIDEIARGATRNGGKLEVDGRAEPMQQDSGGELVIGVRGEPGIPDGGEALTAGQVLGEGAGVIAVPLHAKWERVEAAGDGLEVPLRQNMRRRTAHMGDQVGIAHGERDRLALEPTRRKSTAGPNPCSRTRVASS